MRREISDTTLEGMSLFHVYKKLGRETTSYYGINIDANKIFTNTDAAKNCSEFINEHFKKGSKKEALSVPWDCFRDAGSKSTHMVSLYLLALSLQNCFSEKLKEKLVEHVPESSDWYDYRYTCFLVCLYHDIASCIEKQIIVENTPENQRRLEFYLEAYKIQYTPFKHKALNGTTLVRFPEETIKNYFLYQATHGEPEFDHGIIGGYILFDLLCKNYQKKTNRDPQGTRESMVDINYLHWRRSHIDHFAYICDTIICHNLWTANLWVQPNAWAQLEKAKKYDEAGLQKLIIADKKERLSFKDHPLNFLFCLLDSIEPVKKFEGNRFSARDILQMISITAEDNGAEKCKINIEWDNRIKDLVDKEKWDKKLLKLQEWLDICVEPIGPKISISFER